MFDPYYKWLGIPPKDQPPNHYRLLGLQLFEPDVEVIEAAANRQMAYVQQRATGEHAAVSQKLLNELSAARVCLLNPQKKAGYDAALSSKLSAPASTAPVAPSPIANRSSGQPKARPASSTIPLDTASTPRTRKADTSTTTGLDAGVPPLLPSNSPLEELLRDALPFEENAIGLRSLKSQTRPDSAFGSIGERWTRWRSWSRERFQAFESRHRFRHLSMILLALGFVLIIKEAFIQPTLFPWISGTFATRQQMKGYSPSDSLAQSKQLDPAEARNPAWWLSVAASKASRLGSAQRRSRGKEGTLADIATRYARVGNFSEARKLVANMTLGHPYTLTALAEISGYEWRSGERSSAEDTLREALDQGNHVKDVNQRFALMVFETFLDTAWMQKTAGNTHGAQKSLDLATTIATERNFLSESWLQAMLAQTQARIGDIEAAATTASHIANPLYRAYACWEIARAQAQAGDVSAAFSTSMRLDSFYQERSLVTVSLVGIKNGQCDYVRAIANSMKTSKHKCFSLAAIAEVESACGQQRTACATLRDAYTVAKEFLRRRRTNGGHAEPSV